MQQKRQYSAEENAFYYIVCSLIATLGLTAMILLYEAVEYMFK
jgi:hypothetical protein